MRIYLPQILIICLLPWLGGCQTYLDKIYLETSETHQDLVRMRGDYSESSKQLQSRIASLEQSEKNHFDILTAQLIDLEARIAQLEKEIVALQGRFQEFEFAQGRPAVGAHPKAADAPADAANGDTLAPPAASVNAGPAGGEPVYTQALQFYNTGNFGQAAQYFRLYLDNHPGGPRAGDSSYWLGECLYSMNQLDAALAAFEATAAHFPAHPSAPSALLKASLIYEELGQPEKALASLKLITINHPNYEQLDRVKARIAELEHAAAGTAP